jgi:hypothetical protein
MDATVDPQVELPSERKKKEPQWRWIRLNFKTYLRLLELKMKLERELKGNVTFNAAIDYLLDRYEEER